MSNFVLPTYVKKVIADYRVVPLASSDPAIDKACAEYVRRWNLPGGAMPSAHRWTGVYLGDELVLVVGEKDLTPTSLEVTDLYPLPGKGRKAVAAVYAVLNTYKALMALGRLSAVACQVLARNKPFQKALSRVFDGVEPAAYIYVGQNV